MITTQPDKARLFRSLHTLAGPLALANATGDYGSLTGGIAFPEINALFSGTR
ncbi:hypothetical protein [Streptomyces sp. NPDC088246]|uniref:hypothetical protein n=1 Tax=Streptomyces sp. NPDC088246 TaxID=3365842 RepID=UPI00381EFA03